MPCSTTQDGRVMVESSDKTWSTGERNGKPLQYSCLENPMNSMKRQKDRMLKDEHLRLVGAQYATGEEWRSNFRKNEEMEPKQKQCPVVGVTGDGSEVQCSSTHYCQSVPGPWRLLTTQAGTKQSLAFSTRISSPISPPLVKPALPHGRQGATRVPTPFRTLDLKSCHLEASLLSSQE